MDLQKTVREIGLFETAVNLAGVIGSSDVIQKVGAAMPLPDDNIQSRIGQAADWLLSFGKTKFFFLSPEIALIEEMGKRSTRELEAILAVPADLDPDAKERLSNNLPRGIVVTILDEPYFPQAFFPGNGIIVISGYLGGGRAMVLQDTYRMAEHYSGFHGKKVFVPYKELLSATRYDNWMEIPQFRLNTIWRNEV